VEVLYRHAYEESSTTMHMHEHEHSCIAGSRLYMRRLSRASARGAGRSLSVHGRCYVPCVRGQAKDTLTLFFGLSPSPPLALLRIEPDPGAYPPPLPNPKSVEPDPDAHASPLPTSESVELASLPYSVEK
jgi:hypothetical protein